MFGILVPISSLAQPLRVNFIGDLITIYYIKVSKIVHCCIHDLFHWKSTCGSTNHSGNASGKHSWRDCHSSDDFAVAYPSPPDSGMPVPNVPGVTAKFIATQRPLVGECSWKTGTT